MLCCAGSHRGAAVAQLLLLQCGGTRCAPSIPSPPLPPLLNALLCLPSTRRCVAAAKQVRGKAMADKAGDMLDIVRDILLTARLDDRERFKQARARGAQGGGGMRRC